MSFWIVAIILAVGVSGYLALVLARARKAAAPGEAFDIQVYRDQLKEVERDLARGLISEAEAEQVRTEVSRRLLEADKAAARKSAEDGEERTQSALLPAFVIGVLVVAGAVVTYLQIGAPGYPDLPLAERIAAAEKARAERPSQAEAEEQAAPNMPQVQVNERHAELMQQLREALRQRPDDLEGHILLARNEAAIGNFKAAYEAQQRVIELKGDQATGEDYSALADMMILAAGGYVSPEAEAALVKALQLDPNNGAAQYYSGLMFAQTGRPDVAFRIWRDLLEASPPDAPWVSPIREQILIVAQDAGVRYELPPVEGTGAGPIAPGGPSAEDIAAAQDMSPEERQQMVSSMVNRLARRLATEGGTADEWARLIRALGVLGETGRAQAIWTEAKAVFANTPEKLAIIRDAARQAGILAQ